MKKSIIIFLTVILYILYIISMYTQRYDFVILGDNTIIKYKNNKIQNIKVSDKAIKKFNFEKIKLYDENYIRMGYINFNEDIELYDTTFDKISITQDLIISSENISLKLPSMTKNIELSDDDIEVIEEALNENIKESNIINFLKYNVDIDNDGEPEDVYSIKYFGDNIVIYNFIKESDDSIIDIDMTSVPINEESGQLKVFMNAVDLDFDGNYELIVENIPKVDAPSKYDIYKYDIENNKMIKFK